MFTIEPNMDHFLAFDEDGRQVAKIYDEEFAEKLAAVVNSHAELLEAAKAMRNEIVRRVGFTATQWEEAIAQAEKDFSSVSQNSPATDGEKGEQDGTVQS